MWVFGLCSGSISHLQEKGDFEFLLRRNFSASSLSSILHNFILDYGFHGITVLKTDAACLCEAFRSSIQLGIILNVTKAVTLLAACKVSAPSATNYRYFVYLVFDLVVRLMEGKEKEGSAKSRGMGGRRATDREGRVVRKGCGSLNGKKEEEKVIEGSGTHVKNKSVKHTLPGHCQIVVGA
ncbi:hypothetical protein K1719_033898 [Acacia pycnantha]|nr:hypothetical protein K1719_033898 [Acacia pycnantha]